jgi:hypothetical protein
MKNRHLDRGRSFHRSMRSGHTERESRGRIPRRPTDRVVDAVAWLLTALGLLAVVVALSVGSRVYAEEQGRARVEAADRVPVTAVVLAQPPAAAPPSQGVRAPRPVPMPVPVRYTTRGGITHDGQARLVGAPPPGTPVPVWVDRAGALTVAPRQASDVAAAAAASALAVVVLAVVALAGLWMLVSLVVGRVNAARWEREWARFEPRWSGRVP